MGNQPQRRNEGNFKGTITKESYSQNIISTVINGAKLHKVIVMKYYSTEKGTTERVIEPMGVVIRMGRKNVVGWCRLRNDWRTFRVDRINFIAINMSEDFEPRTDYRREDFEDAGSEYIHKEEQSSRDRSDDRQDRHQHTPKPANKEFAFNTDSIKTMSENKLDFSKDNVKEYSEDEEDLAM
jgi:predicted DNA-binding transcriptional regulator YafY